jgi:hypothetical protein
MRALRSALTGELEKLPNLLVYKSSRVCLPCRRENVEHGPRKHEQSARLPNQNARSWRAMLARGLEYYRDLNQRGRRGRPTTSEFVRRSTVRDGESCVPAHATLPEDQSLGAMTSPLKRTTRLTRERLTAKSISALRSRGRPACAICERTALRRQNGKVGFAKTAR